MCEARSHFTHTHNAHRVTKPFMMGSHSHTIAPSLPQPQSLLNCRSVCQRMRIINTLGRQRQRLSESSLVISMVRGRRLIANNIYYIYDNVPDELNAREQIMCPGFVTTTLLPNKFQSQMPSIALGARSSGERPSSFSIG